MQRRHHYEQAFESYLRARRLPYVAVDEARKALLPQDASLRLQTPSGGPGPALKSFDFVLYCETGNLLAEVKGRKIAARPQGAPRAKPRSGGRLESWVTIDDVEALSAWEQLFGEGFQAVFVFVYWCDEQPALPLFEELFEFRDRWYAIRAVTLEDYRAAMRPRSVRWRTVHLSTADFDRACRPLTGPWSAPLPSP